MFGFEIKIMDKCCVCSKQPWIRSRLKAHTVKKKKKEKLTEQCSFLQCSQCCFCTAYTPHMNCIRTANGVCVKQVHLTYSSWNQACAVCKLLCNNCTIVKTKMQCMIKRLGEINIYFWKMSKKCPPPPLKFKNPLSQELPKRGIHFQKWNSGPE